jgi:hypothetical protein
MVAFGRSIPPTPYEKLGRRGGGMPTCCGLAGIYVVRIRREPRLKWFDGQTHSCAAKQRGAVLCRRRQPRLAEGDGGDRALPHRTTLWSCCRLHPRAPNPHSLHSPPSARTPARSFVPLTLADSGCRDIPNAFSAQRPKPFTATDFWFGRQATRTIVSGVS